MTLITVGLAIMVLGAVWASTTTLLLRATVGLALTSAMLALVMYSLGAMLAAVVELSVCAGLISVVFVTVVSLTQRRPFREIVKHRFARRRRLWPLPLVLIGTGAGISSLRVPVRIVLPPATTGGDVRVVMWSLRQLDLFGQILILLAGVFGVLVLFKGEGNHGP